MQCWNMMLMLVLSNAVVAANSARHDPHQQQRSLQKVSATPRIVNGNRATEYISFGFSAGALLCGGTLIHDDIFLTAARTYRIGCF